MYFVMKIIEFIILKRIIKNFNSMTAASSLVVFALCCLSVAKRVRDPELIIIVYFISALLISTIRIFWHKRRSSKSANDAVSSV